MSHAPRRLGTVVVLLALLCRCSLAGRFNDGGVGVALRHVGLAITRIGSHVSLATG